VLLDEIIFRHFQVLGEGWDLLRGKSDIAGPSTAGGASLALKNRFHDQERAIPQWGGLRLRLLVSLFMDGNDFSQWFGNFRIRTCVGRGDRSC
jgi:hypothetical protein